MHFEHCRLSAGRCRDPRHLNAKQSSSVISAHSDWCGTGKALCERDETDHFKILLGLGGLFAGFLLQRPNFCPCPVHVGFMVNKLTLGQDFLQELWLSPSVLFLTSMTTKYFNPAIIF
jgi:hypothetical protein